MGVESTIILPLRAVPTSIATPKGGCDLPGQIFLVITQCRANFRFAGCHITSIVQFVTVALVLAR